MNRVLTDLSAVRVLTVDEQAALRGGLSSLAITLIGLGIVGVGAYAVSRGYHRGINNKIKQLFRMAPRVSNTRRSNCVTWSDGERNCYA